VIWGQSLMIRGELAGAVCCDSRYVVCVGGSWSWGFVYECVDVGITCGT
jgi:hypothetical protein